jgi:hypothetical protein
MNVFDLGDNRYTAQVVPDCYPHERQPALANWSYEELEMYCGIYPVRTQVRADGVRVTTFGPGALYDSVVYELPDA